MRTPEEVYRAIRECQALAPSGNPRSWVWAAGITAEESRAFADWAADRHPCTLLSMEAQAVWMHHHHVPTPSPHGVKWRYVSGGRAVHAFRGESGLPLCGVVPERANGLPPHWNDAAGTPYGPWRRRNRHAECVRLASEQRVPL